MLASPVTSSIFCSTTTMRFQILLLFPTVIFVAIQLAMASRIPDKDPESHPEHNLGATPATPATQKCATQPCPIGKYVEPIQTNCYKFITPDDIYSFSFRI